jgi:DNA-directed RNA polymerase specialized sigma24 family protein
VEARFRALFGVQYHLIAGYFRARGHRAGDVDDLVAATFEVAWRQRDTVPPDD